MTPDQKIKAKKLLTFADNPQLALFDELQEMNAYLKMLYEKEIPKVEIPKMPDIPPCPEIPEVDFTETNKLLTALLEELRKPKKEKDIEITLDVI